MNAKPAFPRRWRTRKFLALLLTVQAAALFLFLGAIPGASAAGGTIVAALPADTAFAHFYPVPMIANDGVPGGGEDDATLELVNEVASMLESGDYDGLMAMAVPQTLDCTPIEGSWPLCEGLPLDAEVEGFRIAIHGSHGQQVDEAGLRSEFEQSNGRGAQRVSYGCAVDMPACDGLIVVFEEEPFQSPSEGPLPRVFYIVLVGGDIIGAGKSGDNAADFLREGEAVSLLGTTAITLLP